MNNFMKMGMAATAMLAATSVQAATFTFDTTKAGSQTVVDGPMTYTLGTGTQALTMKASAWSLNATTAGYDVVGTSQLVSYTMGLGVISAGDSPTNNSHTIDNQGATDFILLQFSQAVSFGATLRAYAVGQSQADADLVIKWGTLAGGTSNSLSTLAGAKESTLEGYFTGSVDSGDGQSLNLSGATGNLWLIGASQANRDGLFDGLKLSTVTVTTVAAVPEPATWAMMLVGFGMVGAATRYRRRRTTAVYA